MNYKWIPVLLILVVLISGCTSSTSPPKEIVEPVHTAPTPVGTTANLPKTVTVEIDDFLFFPPEVVIAKGGTVTWKQKQYEEHRVVGPGFDSGNLARGKLFNYTFSEAGTFEYTCSLHPIMKGKIIVK